MRRFTRLTNGFSKKFDNHCHALALYFVWYNLITLTLTIPSIGAIALYKCAPWPTGSAVKRRERRFSRSPQTTYALPKEPKKE